MPIYIDKSIVNPIAFKENQRQLIILRRFTLERTHFVSTAYDLSHVNRLRLTVVVLTYYSPVISTVQTAHRTPTRERIRGSFGNLSFFSDLFGPVMELVSNLLFTQLYYTLFGVIDNTKSIQRHCYQTDTIRSPIRSR